MLAYNLMKNGGCRCRSWCPSAIYNSLSALEQLSLNKTGRRRTPDGSVLTVTCLNNAVKFGGFMHQIISRTRNTSFISLIKSALAHIMDGGGPENPVATAVACGGLNKMISHCTCVPPVQELPGGFWTQPVRLAVRTWPTWRADHDQETAGQTAQPMVNTYWKGHGADNSAQNRADITNINVNEWVHAVESKFNNNEDMFLNPVCMRQWYGWVPSSTTNININISWLDSRTAEWFTSHEHSQRDVGMRRQHVDVVLTQWVDDDRFAPINQVSRNLKDLSGNIMSQDYEFYERKLREQKSLHLKSDSNRKAEEHNVQLRVSDSLSLHVVH